MASVKGFFYDWLGGNEALFRQVNGSYSDLSDRAALLLNQAGDHHHFPYIMVGLFGIAILDYLIRSTTGRAGTKQRLVSWLGVFCVLGVGYVTDFYIIDLLKGHFSYPRPYQLFGIETVHVLEIKAGAGESFRSFPSGHAAFVTLLAIGLSPVLGNRMRSLMALLVVAVCWARIASGVHFPADVLGGVLLTAFVVSIVRSVIHTLLRSFFGLRC